MTEDSARLTKWICPYDNDWCGEGGKFCAGCDDDFAAIAEDSRYVFKEKPPAKSSTRTWNIEGAGDPKGRRE